MNLYTARAIARQLMNQHGLTDWTFRFDHARRRFGSCQPRRRWITLSAPLTLLNNEEEVRDTILHEIAHALVGPGHGHDAVWKAKCVEVGARPERCYGEQVAMPKGQWRATCGGCGREHDRHRRPNRLTGWHCRGCGKERGALVWKPAG